MAVVTVKHNNGVNQPVAVATLEPGAIVQLTAPDAVKGKLLYRMDDGAILETGKVCSLNKLNNDVFQGHVVGSFTDVVFEKAGA